ncbi:MAG: hypothetical protein AB1671_12945 [Thermodesulfobacteriota bacterium]|jgi:hypothetical protein
MEELDIRQQLNLLQKEIEAAVSLTEDTKLDLRAAIDTIKLEVEILKRFITRHHADFAAQYPKLREEIIREVDPEWNEPTTK